MKNRNQIIYINAGESYGTYYGSLTGKQRKGKQECFHCRKDIDKKPFVSISTADTVESPDMLFFHYHQKCFFDILRMKMQIVNDDYFSGMMKGIKLFKGRDPK